MRVVKTIKQSYQPSDETLALLNDFRCMVNDCIRIGIKENITSMKQLSLKTYHTLKTYDISTRYRLTAISSASGMLRNYRKSLRKNPNTKTPYATKLRLIDCYGFRIQGKRVRLTLRDHEYIYIVLDNHTLQVLSEPNYIPKSICLSIDSLSITYSKEVAPRTEPKGFIGIDRNIDNITTCTTNGQLQLHNLSDATRIKSTYREVKSHFTRNDVRIKKQISQKYGKKQTNKISQILHHVSKAIVQEAKINRFGIIMENLKGIRKLYRKGNGQGRNYRAKLNGWSFYELQRQIEYKAKWEGIPVMYIPPQKTSSTCSICGSRITECVERKVWCQNCKTLVDRDVNAARNILAKGGLRFGPYGQQGEAMVQKRDKADSNPESRLLEVSKGILVQTKELTEPVDG